MPRQKRRGWKERKEREVNKLLSLNRRRERQLKVKKQRKVETKTNKAVRKNPE